MIQIFTEKRVDRTGRYLANCLKNQAKSTHQPCFNLTGGVISFLASYIPFWHFTFLIRNVSYWEASGMWKDEVGLFHLKLLQIRLKRIHIDKDTLPIL